MTAADTKRARALRAASIYVPLVLVTSALAVVTTRKILALAGGPAVPLDDAYIHFQYARSVAELHPFRYTRGAVPTPGATSLLWPLVLAPFYALGLRGANLVWAAWALGWTSLALLANETRRLAEGLVRPSVAIVAGAMVLAFGGYTWFAASGMEVVPFAWILTRTVRRAAEWVERPRTVAPTPPSFGELVLLAALAPLMRPEGAVASLVVAGALLLRAHGGSRFWAFLALAGPLFPSIVCFVATGQAVTSTAMAKWLPLNPYYRGSHLFSAIEANAEIFFGTLLDGRLWTSVFLPTGGRALAVLAVLAIPIVGALRFRTFRALAVFTLALAALAPTTYETFLVNRVRYIWPFASAWFVGLAALAELTGDLVERGLRRLGIRLHLLPVLNASVVVALLASRLEPSLNDLAESARAVTLQQVSLAKWAGVSLPIDARIGVNDTGAMAYFSNRATFDVVGLTTAGEARYWTAGPGSRFEHYERLPRSRLPGYFVVYPEWFAVPPLLGAELAYRYVRHTILGGATMIAYEARYDLLGSGERPLGVALGNATLFDALDVADLEDESAHSYRLFDATSQTNIVISGSDRADGGRSFRRHDHFTLRLAPSGLFVARWGAENPVRVRMRIDGSEIGVETLVGSAWQEIVVPVPASLRAGSHTVDVDADDDNTFTSLHYWSYARP